MTKSWFKGLILGLLLGCVVGLSVDWMKYDPQLQRCNQELGGCRMQKRMLIDFYSIRKQEGW